MPTRTRAFDPADFLKSEADVVAYLKTWMEDGTPQEIGRALSDIARARGMDDLAKTLSDDSNPTLEPLLAVLDALGLELTVQKKVARG